MFLDFTSISAITKKKKKTQPRNPRGTMLNFGFDETSELRGNVLWFYLLGSQKFHEFLKVFFRKRTFQFHPLYSWIPVLGWQEWNQIFRSSPVVAHTPRCSTYCAFWVAFLLNAVVESGHLSYCSFPVNSNLSGFSLPSSTKHVFDNDPYNRRWFMFENKCACSWFSHSYSPMCTHPSLPFILFILPFSTTCPCVAVTHV